MRISSKIARTPCYYADAGSVIGSRFEQYRFLDYGLLRFSMALGLRNELNTAFLPIGTPDEARACS